MNVLHLTLPAPEQNLALDEALLDDAEANEGPETLRFWEPDRRFVVLGYGKKAEEEVFLTHCRADAVPVLRRTSGGGTVLQGPECLNYALILDMQTRPEVRNLLDANRHIMSRHAEALRTLASDVALRGTTDLTTGDQKFMGNAQRRKRRFLLFHGCILLRVDGEAMERYLCMPGDRPDYRKNRSHREFVAPFPASADQVRRTLQAAWKNSTTQTIDPVLEWKRLGQAVETLVREKYSRAEWNLKY